MSVSVGAWLSLARAPGSGPGGRWFKSIRPDHFQNPVFLERVARPIPCDLTYDGIPLVEEKTSNPKDKDLRNSIVGPACAMLSGLVLLLNALRVRDCFRAADYQSGQISWRHPARIVPRPRH